MSAPALDPVVALGELFRSAIARAFPDVGEADAVITQSKQSKLGDFQCNAAMALARRLGKNPREVAGQIVRHLGASELIEPLGPESIAGPGFINIRLRGAGLASLLGLLDTPSLGVPAPARRQTIVVDLMGVNLAKQMHVGHLRSPFIGDAIARAWERLGHTVKRQNHVGDWGLPIAMVVMRLMDEARAGQRDLANLTLDDLDTAYKDSQAQCQRDTAGLEAARRWGMGPKALAELEEQVAGATEAFTRARQTLVRLQAREPETFAVWQRIADVTMAVCLEVCRRLHVKVTAEHSAGESSYASELPGLVEDLVSRGIAVEDQGALIVRLDDPPPGRDGRPLWEAVREPCLIRKSDGGYLYATTDIAAVRRRVQTLHADRVIYAIDARQSLHMKQVFGASRKAGYAVNPISGEQAALEHAAFGAILGEDGRPFKTRSGDPVRLSDLLDQTAERALAAVRARTPDLPEDEARTIAEAVGVAALKYGDLASDRVKDCVFSLDRMLAFEGNTGPYLLYAVARIHTIFRKASERGVLDPDPAGAVLRLDEPAERALAMALLRYPAALAGAAATAEPHHLCAHAFDLASAFAVFYDQCPVLAAPDEPVRRSRLRLCDLTRRVLTDGLGVLGIPTLERM